MGNLNLRNPGDAELAAFHGGSGNAGGGCVITVHSDGRVTTNGQCQNVTVTEVKR